MDSERTAASGRGQRRSLPPGRYRTILAAMRADRSLALACLAIFCVAIALRVASIGQRELWLDECVSVVTANATDGAWAASMREGGNPPLYFLTLKLWTAVFGLGEAGVRSLSIVLGVLQLGALGLLAVALAIPTRAMLFALGLLCVASLHVFYSVEGRPYMLLLLLLTASQAALIAALRTRRAWLFAAHGLSLAAAWYTHNLALPFTLAFWLILPLVRAERRSWILLASTHAGAAILYLPWAVTLVAQTQSEAHLWIRDWWLQTPQLLMIPRSLEVLGVGGSIPTYVPLPGVPTPVRIAAVAAATLALVSAFVPLPPGRSREADGRTGAFAVSRPVQLRVLLVFLLVPLVFLIAYSNLVAPLYLIGRYDLPAQPAYALLVGLGLQRLVSAVPRSARRAASAGIAALAVLLAFYSHRQALTSPSLSARPGFGGALGEVLEAHADDDDVILATGYTTAYAANQLMFRKLDIPLVTYPPSLAHHVGWYNPERELARGREALTREAEQILEQIEPAAGSRRLVWVLAEPAPPGDPQRLVAAAFSAAARERGYRSWFPGDTAGRWPGDGIFPIYHPNSTPDERAPPDYWR